MKRLLRSWLATPLWQRIMAALVLGALVGWGVGPQIESIRWMGDLFVRMIRMLVAPLVFVTLVAGITAMKEPTRIASIGGRALGLYIVTTLGAIVIGLTLAGLLGPGRGVTLSEGGQAVDLADPAPLAERLLAIVPNNVFAAFAEGDILGLIFFGVLLGVGVLLAGERGRPIGRLFESGADVMLKVTGVVMELAPFGVFALVAWVVGVQGAGAFVNIFLLAAIVYGGGALQMLIVHGGLVRGLGRMKIRDFFAAIRTPQVLAFSTSSSAATLPAALTAAETNLKIRPPVASSVIPLGATINMDGTALYVAAVAVFAAQAFGVLCPWAIMR
jgi:Na+/H+-dicarboxylate symporter